MSSTHLMFNLVLLTLSSTIVIVDESYEITNGGRRSPDCGWLKYSKYFSMYAHSVDGVHSPISFLFVFCHQLNYRCVSQSQTIVKPKSKLSPVILHGEDFYIFCLKNFAFSLRCTWTLLQCKLSKIRFIKFFIFSFGRDKNVHVFLVDITLSVSAASSTSMSPNVLKTMTKN